MSYTGTLAELRAKFREYTGLSQTADMADSVCNDRINDYYVHRFPHDAMVDEFDIWITQALLPTDDGEYTIDDEIDRLDEPVTVNGAEIRFFRDREDFFEYFPLTGEQYVTAPSLAAGSSDSKKVANSAFTYKINDYSYPKAAAETAFSGLSTVPQNKYGAFSLKVDDDGDITIAEASGNSSGYDTPRLALEGLGYSDGDSCYMGFVTVICTAAAGFIPGTTALDAGTVTDTYTDGLFETRSYPQAALLYGTKLYIRPKPNDVAEFKAMSIADRPTVLSADDSVVADVKWWKAIACGAAREWAVEAQDTTKMATLSVSLKDKLGYIKKDKIKRLLGEVVKRRY